MQDLGFGIATPAQTAFDVEHATQIAEHDRVGARRERAFALVVREPRRDRAELDRESSAETAARLRLVHFLELEPRNSCKQRARLRLDAHLAQSGERIVVRDAAAERYPAPVSL